MNRRSFLAAVGGAVAALTLGRFGRAAEKTAVMKRRVTVWGPVLSKDGQFATIRATGVPPLESARLAHQFFGTINSTAFLGTGQYGWMCIDWRSDKNEDGIHETKIRFARPRGFETSYEVSFCIPDGTGEFKVNRVERWPIHPALDFNRIALLLLASAHE